MSDTSGLTAGLAAVKAQIADLGTRMDKRISDLEAAHNAGDQAAIDAATAELKSDVADLKAIADRDAPAPTPAPSP